MVIGGGSSKFHNFIIKHNDIAIAIPGRIHDVFVEAWWLAYIIENPYIYIIKYIYVWVAYTMSDTWL